MEALLAADWPRILARRRARHFLSRPAPRSDLADVVGAVCGIHAQVMASAAMSLGLRVRGLTAAGLRDALWRDRTLVKTYGLRGTVHLFPARELPLWNAAVRAVSREDPRRLGALGMTSAQYRGLAAAIADAVDRNELTKAELGEEVARRVGRWATDRKVSAFGGAWGVWQAAIGEAAHDGLLCFGPDRGARVTYVRPDRWLGRQRAVDPSKALAEVVRRYLAAYGPATHREVAQWLAADPKLLLATIRALGAAVEEVEAGGARAWQIAGDRPRRADEAAIDLVPRFDVYVVGSHPRDALAPPAVVERAARTGLFTRGRAVRPLLVGPTPVLLVGGRIAGIWESRRSGSRSVMRIQPFTRLTASQREEVAERAERLAAVFGLAADVSFGSVSTGPHL